uniref:Uncharacterized protein n=1 Tax=Eutreptiella gymnastica TaxID=73025 RepID=A0A7S4LMB9_9EUGL
MPACVRVCPERRLCPRTLEVSRATHGCCGAPRPPRLTACRTPLSAGDVCPKAARFCRDPRRAGGTVRGRLHLQALAVGGCCVPCRTTWTNGPMREWASVSVCLGSVKVGPSDSHPHESLRRWVSESGSISRCPVSERDGLIFTTGQLEKMGISSHSPPFPTPTLQPLGGESNRSGRSQRRVAGLAPGAAVAGGLGGSLSFRCIVRSRCLKDARAAGVRDPPTRRHVCPVTVMTVCGRCFCRGVYGSAGRNGCPQMQKSHDTPEDRCPLFEYRYDTHTSSACAGHSALYIRIHLHTLLHGVPPFSCSARTPQPDNNASLLSVVLYPALHSANSGIVLVV